MRLATPEEREYIESYMAKLHEAVADADTTTGMSALINVLARYIVALQTSEEDVADCLRDQCERIRGATAS